MKNTPKHTSFPETTCVIFYIEPARTTLSRLSNNDHLRLIITLISKRIVDQILYVQRSILESNSRKTI